MKYIVLLGDGMPDYPIAEIGGKTILEAANTPNMDYIAKNGSVGLLKTIPKGFHPGSDITNLGILGFDPAQYYTGRAPLEAAGMGIQLEKNDVAFRCNMVTLKPNPKSVIMEDFSADHIKTEDAKELIDSINKNIGSEKIIFHPGVSYRHLMIWKDGLSDFNLTPPHDISGKDIKNYLPKGEGAHKLTKLISESQIVLSNHKINIDKKNKGSKQANSIWLWGQGTMPVMPSFKSLFNIEGSVITAVDLIRGIAIYTGLEPVEVPGATGYLDTNFKGKAEYALKELEHKDFVYVHVEAPDEAGHSGSVNAKIKAIEDFDSMVVGTVIEGMKKFSDYRILVLSDHPTPVSLKTHSEEPVPFGIYPPIDSIKGANLGFSEKINNETDFLIEKVDKMMDFLIKKQI